MQRRLSIPSSRISLSSFLSKSCDDWTFLSLPASHQLIQFMGISTKKQANEIRTGNILEFEGGKLMQVLKYAHSQTGRQLGNIQLQLRDVITRAKHPLRLRPSDMVDVVRLEERTFQFLYQEGDDSLHCMDPKTYEQIVLQKDILGERGAFLVEGGDIVVSFHEGTPVSGELPPQVTLEVKEAAPHMRGESQAPQQKPAVVETGATVYVPSFVVAGDRIIVDTADGTFVKRAV